MLADRNLHDAAPWAWTPAAVDIARGFEISLKHRPPTWQDRDGMFYRKSWSTKRLGEWLADDEPLDCLCGPEVVGEVVNSVEQFDAARVEFESRGFEHLI